MKSRRVFLTIICLFVFINVCSSQDEYILRAQDVLSITVQGEPDLTTQTRVNATGKITFPLVGTVDAAGLTVQGLQDRLTELLKKDYFVDPQVIVYIGEYSPKQVSVLGWVNKPGTYNMFDEKETTVLDAIAMAGGFAKEAAANSTKILRMENGKEETIFIKVDDITKKGQKEKDLPVKPNDVIFVPESFF